MTSFCAVTIIKSAAFCPISCLCPSPVCFRNFLPLSVFPQWRNLPAPIFQLLRLTLYRKEGFLLTATFKVKTGIRVTVKSPTYGVSFTSVSLLKPVFIPGGCIFQWLQLSFTLAYLMLFILDLSWKMFIMSQAPRWDIHKRQERKKKKNPSWSFLGLRM